ncbi:MAG TPA: hypothetical protein VFB54_20025 [Burkholderiales bacterium]|nr:hypothetical protein [Burkholderiales bacterium]
MSDRMLIITILLGGGAKSALAQNDCGQLPNAEQLKNLLAAAPNHDGEAGGYSMASAWGLRG